eukprot:143239-Rhodomonas_salina.4
MAQLDEKNKQLEEKAERLAQVWASWRPRCFWRGARRGHPTAQVSFPLACYALAMQCPVLIFVFCAPATRCLVSHRHPIGRGGGAENGGRGLCVCYAMPGTDLGTEVASYAMSGTDMAVY